MSFRRARVAAAVLTGVALAAVAGCGAESLSSNVHPGAAAVVDGERITVAEVDEMAEAYCDFVAARMSAEQAVPMRLVRGASLDNLVRRTVAEQYAEAHDLDTRRARRLLAREVAQQAEQQQISGAEREVFEEVSLEVDTTAVYLAAGAREALEAGETPDPDAVGAGRALVAEWAADKEITRDPRFTTLEAETYDVDAAALAQPRSDLATLAGAFDPQAAIDPDYLAALPASQTCAP